ncbi:MAG: hypothetical protein ACTSQQ_14785, partial [Candidatus Helarchaeota archaeon]
IDIIIDRGELKDLRKLERYISKFFPGYNRDISFIRTIDGIASQKDIEQFIDDCKDFGYECRAKERCTQYFDYFPSKILIVAKEFSPTALERVNEITKVDRKRKKHYILSNHLNWHAKLKSRGMVLFNCYVELWKWQHPHPNRIFS